MSKLASVALAYLHLSLGRLRKYKSDTCVREAAKNSSFLSGPATKAFTPPPSA